MLIETVEDMGAGFAPSNNGHIPAEDTAPVLPRVDTQRGVIITRDTTELTLSGNAITSLMIERVINEGKPDIPQVQVTIGGKYKQIESNPNDPNYIAALERWQEESNRRLLRYLIVRGIRCDVPETFIAEHREYFPNANDNDMKYLYVVSLIPDTDVSFFMDAVMGRTMPTASGLEEAATSFRSQG